MSVLLVRLAGPMQSWGTQSRFSNRDTGLEPSKSGVIGLICAALGFPRDADSVTRNGLRITLTDLVKLKMAVRVDREGRMSRDYQTTGGEQRAGSVLGFDRKGKPIPYGVAKADGKTGGTVLSDRYYLADADFLVGLEGDGQLLHVIDNALVSPVWPLYLGRKSFVPAWQVRVGVLEGDLLSVVASKQAWWKWRRFDTPPQQIRMVVESGLREGVEVRQDVPLGFDPSARRHGHCTTRHVETRYLPDDELNLDLPPVEDAPWLS